MKLNLSDIRGSQTVLNKKNGRRVVKSSYGTRSKPAQIQLKNMQTSPNKKSGTVGPNLKLQIEKNPEKINVTRSQAFSLTSPKSDAITIPYVGTLTPQQMQPYTSPKMDHENIVTSHRSFVRHNVAQFIKDHGLGTRHFLSKEGMSRTTAMETPDHLSENIVVDEQA